MAAPIRVGRIAELVLGAGVLVLLACGEGQHQDPYAAPHDATDATCSEEVSESPALRRLSHQEYDRSVAALLGDETRPSRAFPEDQDEHDLQISPQLLAAYAGAAERLVSPHSIPCDEPGCVRVALRGFARRAWSRPVTEGELERLEALGVRLGMRAVLISPSFVLRSGGPGNHELARRLAYFLWSAPPDEALLALADAGALSDPGVVERQARRMLASPKIAGLVEGFAARWLSTRALEEARPDPEVFPDFDEPLRGAMREETLRLIAAVLAEGRSVEALLTADFTFVNDRLARHYGLPETGEPGFRRVARQQGLLGHAGVLTATSLPRRTSPTRRGRFILEQLLCEPPATPPQIAFDVGRGSGSLRERLDQIAADPTCAACHAQMDPLGLDLEAYDGIGARRGDETAAADLTRRLATDDRFTACVARRLFERAAGRRVTKEDGCALRAIVEADGRLSEWVVALALRAAQGR